MIYLSVQIFVGLLVAFVLGVLLGGLLGRLCGRCRFCGGADKSDTALKRKAPTAASLAAIEPGEADVDEGIALDTSVDVDGAGYEIESLEGIGPQTGQLLRGYGVASVGDYLRKLNLPAAREKAAKELNIKAQPLHDWASMADLLRVEGVDHQFAELAYASGIRSVLELAQTDAAVLAAKMDTTNKAGKQLMAPHAPSVEQVEDWVTRAKGMKSVVQA